VIGAAGDQLRGVGFDGDLVTEGFEFMDESAFAGFGIVDPGFRSWAVTWTREIGV
jgi:hypothetical protein